MDKSKLEGHLAELVEYHHGLDKKIKEGYTNYMDDVGLSKMKQEKAHVRRQIEDTKQKLDTL